MGHPALGQAIPAPSRNYIGSQSVSVRIDSPGIPLKSPVAALASSAERLEEELQASPQDVRLRLLLAKSCHELGSFNFALTNLLPVEPARRTPDGELLLALSLMKAGQKAEAETQ